MQLNIRRSIQNLMAKRVLFVYIVGHHQVLVDHKNKEISVHVVKVDAAHWTSARLCNVHARSCN